MDLRLENLFHCQRCQFWYLRDEEEGPEGECKHCFWNIPLNRKAIVTVKMMVIVMARRTEVLSQSECWFQRRMTIAAFIKEYKPINGNRFRVRILALWTG